MRRLAIVLVLVASPAWAERPPQFKKDADVVVTGKVASLLKHDKPFGGDGVMTTYIATVSVSKVEKGDVKAGDTIDVTWFHVTKRPTKPFVGAFGHKYAVKAGDAATFWLTGKKPPYAVIYGKDGVEKK